jgi:hypothetical protein
MVRQNLRLSEFPAVLNVRQKEVLVVKSLPVELSDNFVPLISASRNEFKMSAKLVSRKSTDTLFT